ncbi:MAG: DUF4384 domain-containing protein [Gammaproteobacteria bacterium]|nr:DUF4384 domain-containing protein [Gammaproteobacteria bacterium]
MCHLRTYLLAACLSCSVFVTPVMATDIDLSVEARHIREDRSQVIFPVTDGAVLRSGDGLRVRLEVLERAPVYLMFVGSSGNPSMVLPGRQEDIGKQVPAGAVVEIPPEGTFFNLDENTGDEAIFAFTGEATPRQIGRLLDDIRAAAGDIPRITRLIMDDFETVERVAFEHIPAGPLEGIGFTVPEKRGTGSGEGHSGAAETRDRAGEPATGSRPRGFRFVIPQNVGDELDDVLSEEGSLIPGDVRIPDAAGPAPASP